MTALRAVVEGSKEVEVALGRISAALDPVGILDEASALVLNRIRARFKAETDIEDRPWAPLKRKTVLERIRKGFGPRPILFRTGNLYHSIQLSRLGETSREIKTDVEYAGYLQFGGEHLPARPFLGINQQDIDLVTALIVRRVQGALT